jgi:hypothetical protein
LAYDTGFSDFIVVRVSDWDSALDGTVSSEKYAANAVKAIYIRLTCGLCINVCLLVKELAACIKLRAVVGKMTFLLA